MVSYKNNWKMDIECIKFNAMYIFESKLITKYFQANID